MSLLDTDFLFIYEFPAVDQLPNGGRAHRPSTSGSTFTFSIAVPQTTIDMVRYCARYQLLTWSASTVFVFSCVLPAEVSFFFLFVNLFPELITHFKSNCNFF